KTCSADWGGTGCLYLPAIAAWRTWEFALTGEPWGAGVLASVRRGLQCLRRDEALQPAGPRMQLAPVVDGEMDDDEAGGRQVLAQSLAHLDVARSDQRQHHLVQARIVANHQQSMRNVGRALDDGEDGVRRCIVKRVGGRRRRLWTEGAGRELPRRP